MTLDLIIKKYQLNTNLNLPCYATSNSPKLKSCPDRGKYNLQSRQMSKCVLIGVIFEYLSEQFG